MPWTSTRNRRFSKLWICIVPIGTVNKIVVPSSFQWCSRIETSHTFFVWIVERTSPTHLCSHNAEVKNLRHHLSEPCGFVASLSFSSASILFPTLSVFSNFQPGSIIIIALSCLASPNMFNSLSLEEWLGRSWHPPRSVLRPILVLINFTQLRSFVTRHLHCDQMELTTRQRVPTFFNIDEECLCPVH